MGAKNLVLGSFCVIMFIGLISAISAEISISQPGALYNLGESFSVDVEVSEIIDSYLDVDMVCSGVSEGTQSLYHGILTEKIIKLERKLTPVYIGNLSGICYIGARYGNLSQTSQNFAISNIIDVKLELGEMHYLAGESVNVKGTAVKKSGEGAGISASAFVGVALGNESKASGSASNGAFNLNFETLSNMPSGSYPLIVGVYDKDEEGNTLNFGETRADLIIKQLPSYLELAVDKEMVLPGSNITIIPLLYDKSISRMSGEEVTLRIIDGGGKIMYEKIVKTNEEIVFVPEYNHAAGYSRITAERAGNISAEKIFVVEEYPKIKIDVMNNSLLITNIGNARYSKDIEITLGGKTFVKSVDLEKGVGIRYNLGAPDGSYTLTVADAEGTVGEASGVVLTGNAISIRATGASLGGIFTRYPIVWIFLIILIAGIAIVMYRNLKKRKDYSFPVEEIEIKQKMEKKFAGRGESGSPGGEIQFESTEKIGMIDKEDNVFRPGVITQAENVLVLNGHKQNAGIVVVRIKNGMGKLGKETLNRALRDAYELKGVPCQSGESLIIVFSPLISKSFKNNENAIKAALKIEEALREHNRKFKERINYGIGVNSGDIINAIEKGKLKFASMGQTINLTKRIADISQGEVLLSKEAHEKTMSDVKVDKSEKKAGELELFTVKRIVDNESSRKFIQEFMRRSGNRSELHNI